MKEIFNLAPKRLIRLLTEGLSYTVISFFKSWFISVIAFGVLLLIAYQFFPRALFTKQWVLVIGGTFLLVAVPIAFFRYRKETRLIDLGSGYVIGITEAVMIEDKEHLIVNTDSQKITQKLENSVTAITTTKYPFCKGIVKPLLIQNPKLFYLSHTFSAWRRKLQKLVAKRVPLSVIMITRDLQNKKVDFEIH
jgi:hypothetical protein